MPQIKINYGQAVTTLPAIPADVLERATAADLRLLLLVCGTGSNSGMSLSADSFDDLCAALADHSAGGTMQVATSLAFWRGTGILELSESEEPILPATPLPVSQTSEAPIRTSARSPVQPTEAAAPKRHMTVSDHLPRYNSLEVADLLESRRETRENIDECSRIWGDILNVQEVNTLLGLSDYLGLGWDYILPLVSRCVADLRRQGSAPSMRYVEKLALSYYDEGIRTLDALQEKFRSIDLLRSTEGKLRTLFGMGDRLLTPAEKKYFSTWLHDFHFDFDIIQIAYNLTVDTKGSPKMSYINSVLANWNRDHLRTPAEIEAAAAEWRAEQEKKRTGGKRGAAQPTAPAAPAGSFDTDNFFDAAVRRSLGEDFDPNTIG